MILCAPPHRTSPLWPSRSANDPIDADAPDGADGAALGDYSMYDAYAALLSAGDIHVP